VKTVEDAVPLPVPSVVTPVISFETNPKTPRVTHSPCWVVEAKVVVEPEKLCVPVHAYVPAWSIAEVVHVGLAPVPCEVRNCPDVPKPETMPMALVELPKRTLNCERVVEPVPPLATAIVVPFHIPDVIVPIVAKEPAVVRLFNVITPFIEVVAMVATRSVLRLEKFVFITARESVSLSVD
jgi:hypothetical protein